MNLLRKYWEKLSKNHIKINFDYLFNVIFYIVMCLMCIISIHHFIVTSEEDILSSLGKSLEKATGRRLLNDLLYLKMLKNYRGKRGDFIVIFVIIFFVVIKECLFNLRKFLGKEVEKEEKENEE
ncbi:conserved hypothetical protein [Capnocytophaga canimorsus]|uniref:Uncharacterized protein n=1 Tax=Capnocytophaga canimorsus TaxID=28188 RepID=A0A0B7HKA3_9FLAO|nr:hypothetical protein [Capnocytophaga canimorsus]CEN37973.1 conserved hypothetical protein [Capnocytophaga canimorsus]